MPFVKGNTIGEDTRFKTGSPATPQAAHPTSYDALSTPS